MVVEYQEIDKEIADRALEKNSNHFWYLNAKLVSLALFDPTLPDKEKSRLAGKVLAEAVTDVSDIKVKRAG